MKQNNLFGQNFLILQLQLLVVVILLSGFLLNFVDFSIFLAVEAVLAIYFLFLLFFQIRKEFKEQFNYFLLFFGVLFLLVELSWIIQKIIPAEDETQLNALFGLLFVIIAFSIIYRVIFAKKTIKARIVMSENNSAVVKTDFDIFSFTKAGKHIVEAKKSYPTGKEVEVELKSSFLKTKPWKIKE
ncbi:MAG: DUF2101 family protein [archaeon]|nr:DUF2101 family protein [archaeon]